MIRAIVVLPVLFFLLATSCDTESNLDLPGNSFFVKYYGTDGDQSAVDFELLDDGFLILGNHQLLGVKRIFLARADFNGRLIWQKMLSGPSDIAIDLEPTSDGNFVILMRHEFNATNHDIQLLRIDETGAKIDSSGYYGSPLKETPRSVTALSSGDFLMVGETNLPVITGTDPGPNFFIYRSTSSFQFYSGAFWRQYTGFVGSDFATKIFPWGNEFLLFGHSTRQNQFKLAGKLNGFFVPASQFGEVASNDVPFGNYEEDLVTEFVLKVPEELNGGFLMVGSRSNSNGTQTVQVTKLRSPVNVRELDYVFDREINILNRPVVGVSASASLRDGQGYHILSNEVRTSGARNILVQKIDIIGSLLWSTSLGSEEGDDFGAHIKELPDGKIVVLGTVELGGNQTKIALFKLNSVGKLQ